ncbi:MAG: hypothetical protein ACLFNO_03470 [Parcubacteria group bacterium]
MEENLVAKSVELEDVVLTIGSKAWRVAGFDFALPLSENVNDQILKAIYDSDSFFEGTVRKHQVLVYIPKFDDLGAFFIKWWQEILSVNNLPLSVQFTDIYNISYYFDRLKVDPGWYLFTAKPLPDSTHKTWTQQRQLLKNGYRVPNVHELLTFFIMSYLNGIELEDRCIFGRVVDDFYGVPLSVSQAINKRVNVICEDNENELQDNVGIYACKKII